MGQVGIWQEKPERQPGREGDRDAEARDDQRVLAAALDQSDVGFKPCREDQEQHTQPRHHRQEIGLLLFRGKNKALDVRGDRSEQRRPEQHTCNQFADHSRLLDLPHRFA